MIELSVTGRIFEAFRIIVKADNIKRSNSKKVHQTGTHNASRYRAEGNVSVTVSQSKQSSDRSSSERPSEGTVFKGDSADIVARKKNHIGPDKDDPKRMKGIFSDNVLFRIRKKEAKK